MTEELKPCPFCGAEPQIFKDKDIGLWIVSCGAASLFSIKFKRHDENNRSIEQAMVCLEKFPFYEIYKDDVTNRPKYTVRIWIEKYMYQDFRMGQDNDLKLAIDKAIYEATKDDTG